MKNQAMDDSDSKQRFKLNLKSLQQKIKRPQTSIPNHNRNTFNHQYNSHCMHVGSLYSTNSTHNNGWIGSQETFRRTASPLTRNQSCEPVVPSNASLPAQYNSTISHRPQNNTQSNRKIKQNIRNYETISAQTTAIQYPFEGSFKPLEVMNNSLFRKSKYLNSCLYPNLPLQIEFSIG